MIGGGVEWRKLAESGKNWQRRFATMKVFIYDTFPYTKTRTENLKA
jgi:hypothetical protein